MKKIFQLVIALILTCGLSGFMVSCSKDNPVETPTRDNGTLNVTDPDGTLEVNDTHLEIGEEAEYATLCVTYKNAEGLFMPTLITIEPYVVGVPDGDNMIFYLDVGTYIVRAENLSIIVEVSKKGEI